MQARVLKFLIACALACSLPLWAQESPAADRSGQVSERIEQLKARLKLTPEEVDKLKPIVQEEVKEMRSVRDRMGADTSRRGKATMLREMQAVQKKYEPQIGAVLTPEQKQEWKQIKEERKQKLQEERKKRQGG